MLRGIPDVKLVFNGSEISGSKVVKNLGVTTDRHLNYKAQDALTRKCTGMLIALNHSRHEIPNTTMATLVQGLIISAVRYCISVHGSCNATQLHRIQKND